MVGTIRTAEKGLWICRKEYDEVILGMAHFFSARKGRDGISTFELFGKKC